MTPLILSLQHHWASQQMTPLILTKSMGKSTNSHCSSPGFIGGGPSGSSGAGSGSGVFDFLEVLGELAD